MKMNEFLKHCRSSFAYYLLTDMNNTDFILYYESNNLIC